MARSELTEDEQVEAVKLLYILAAFDCIGSDEDETCDQRDLSSGQSCGPCHAHQFLRTLNE